MALDSAGNIFVTGQSDFNFVAAKYSPSGNPAWIQNYSYSNFTDSATTIAIDLNGDVLVGGTFGQPVEADFGIVKYKNDGTFIWDRRYANTAGSDDILTDMVVDTAGSVYVTGWETYQYSTNYNFMTLKYDSAGTFLYELNWTDSLGVAPDYGKCIGLDSIGNIYVMGDANENCFGNSFVNGFGWNTQVLRYGQGVFSGINDAQSSSNKILVYPNPAGSYFDMKLPAAQFGQEPVEIYFYDVQGRLLLTTIKQPEETHRFETGDWHTGMVFYMARNAHGSHSGKILINQ
jgi:hypothetical protein